MKKITLYSLIISLFISSLSFAQTTTSDNFVFHYTNSTLISQSLIDEMEFKFDAIDKTIREDWSNINLLNRSQKIDVYLYDNTESFPSAPSDIRNWHIGYYSTSSNELHIKVPTTTRQLKYFPNLEAAAVSILARYIVDKKKGSKLVDGRSFAFGLFESGYSPDVNLINTYLSNNSNSFPNGYSSFSTWSQLDDETNVQLAYTYMFASIFRYGYIPATIGGGVWYGYEGDPGGVWYQITRIFFLIDIANGGMRKFVDRDDFVIYSNSQEQADLSLEALQWYANKYDEYYGARINHPLLVAIYGSNETYRYAERGNIDYLEGGGEARGHQFLRTSPATENLTTEKDRVFTKYSGIIGHEFMHNVFAYLAETRPPNWLNEGSAMFGDVGYQEGYKGINVYNMAGKHNFFWNTNSMYFPDLDKIFEMDGDFGYRMGTSAFTFIKNRFPKETLLRFMKNSNDFSTIGYANIGEFQLHLYETLYHKYIPTFLFNPTWDLNRTYTAGSNYTFTWDGHYINDLILEYSTDAKQSWIPITEVALSSGSYNWTIPNATNCILRFSDKKHPEINFTYQILGNKPTIDSVFNMTFENGAINNITSGNSGTGKDYVSYVPRSGNGNYAKFNGLWNNITVQNYPDLNLNENWTIQGDFLIENTTGIMNTKPVLLEKIATNYWHKNYSISFNNNGANKLRFEYQLENNSTVYLDIDAGITNNNWYTFYFARSVENNIVEARVYNQNGTLLGSNSRQLNGEGKVKTGNGGLYLGSGDFTLNERCLQGGLDNIIISDTYHDTLMSNTFSNSPIVSNIPDQTIVKGASFTTIALDDFVSDPDNSDSELTWSYSGNTELSVTIDANRIATITTPNVDWSGSETIIFTATDPDNNTGSDTALFAIGFPVLHFDGVNDYLQLSNFTYPTADMTIEAWIKPSDITSTQEIIFGKNPSNGSAIQFRIDADGRLLYGENPTWAYVTAANCITPNQWNHIALVKENDVCKLYVNGVKLNEYNVNQGVTPTNFSIGGRAENMDRFFEGEMIDLRIWNVARSQSEIQAKMYTVLSASETGLLAYWKMNEGSGQTANNLVNSSFALQLGSTTNDDTNDPVWTLSTTPVSQEVLGVSDVYLDKAFLMYPNPSKNNLNINLPEKVDLSIYTATGQKVLEKKNIKEGIIDISKLRSGLYIVLFKGEKGTLSKKLIIE